MYMTILVAVFVVLAMIGVIAYYWRYKNLRESIAFTVLVAIFATVPPLMIQFFLLGYIPKVQYERKIADLIAMEISEKGTDVFVLGAGSSTSSKYYMVYARNGDGSVSPHHIRVYPHVKLYENEELVDAGSWSETVWVNDYSVSLADWLWIHPRREELVNYKIEVPKDSIKHKFDLNLK